MKQSQGFSLSENTSYKIVALLITLILWVIILGSKEATIVKMIAADYLLPRDMMIVNNVPHQVAFRVTGPRLALKRFTEVAEPLSIDLSSAVEGVSTVRIHPDSINVPAGLRITSVSPASLTPKLERVVHRDVPVQLQTKGTLPEGKKLVSTVITPAAWEVWGARSVIDGIKFLKTTPLDLSEIKESTTKELTLAIDEQNIVQKKEAKVKIDLVVK
ncbi:MAG: CdaR family protein [Oligoflexia bacterium]|nr:CdaR family protein [Oligoflexia bacterium]